MTNAQPNLGAPVPPNLLLIAAESAAQPIAEALRAELRASVETTPSRRSALTLLRRNDFALILLDESLASTDAAPTDVLYQNAGGALVLELNLAVSSAARVVNQAHCALARRTRNLAAARTAATAALRGEINTNLASILLESELALRDATAAQAPRLRHLVHLAEDLRNRLRP